jgi:hypothetical protein
MNATNKPRLTTRVQVHLDTQRIVTDSEYVGGPNAGANEPPLSEQLEPVAVIGMGEDPDTEISPSPCFVLTDEQ